jgi:UDP-GlcNAc:undecaprenyl-phosphate/decaprenyl-phosphate GlcNAc-1-phosphate transferase
MVEVCIGMVWSFALCYLLTPQVRRWASRLGLVDKPDGRRKLHGRCIPVAGGPLLLLSVGVALLVAFVGSGALQKEILRKATPLVGLVLAAVIICAVGVLDDFGRLRGRHKLLGQVIAVAAVIISGVRIDHVYLLNGVDAELGNLAIPFTAFFLLGAINSLNLLDGMDGLLSSIAFFLCLVLGCVDLLAHDYHVTLTAYAAFVTAAALLAFLRYNFPPATIFLGDSGSMLIGLVIGVLAIKSSLKEHRGHPEVVTLIVPIALLILPILDTVAAILRRKLTGRSIYNTDRSHLHHCLLRRLGDPRLVLFVVSFCCVVTGAGVLAGRLFDSDWVIVLSSLSVVVALITTRLFGHAEFRLVLQSGQSLLVSLFHMPSANEPRQIEMRLHGNVDWRELWLRLLEWDVALSLCCLRLDVNAPALGEGYHARWERGSDTNEDEEGVWSAQIPLTFKGRSIGKLEVKGSGNGESVGDKISMLAKLVQDFEDNVLLVANRSSMQRPISHLTSASVFRAADREDPEFLRANL